MIMRTNPNFSRRRRRAGIYFLVLASSVVVALIAMGLSAMVMKYRFSSRTGANIDRAEICADLAVRHALRFTRDTANWRQLLSNGAWLSNIPLDSGISYSVSGTDPLDSNLTDSPADPVILTATATVYNTARTLQATARQLPLDILKYAAASNLKIEIATHARVHGNLISNGTISKTGGDTWVFGSASAVGSIADTTNISGTITTGITPVTFPDPQTIQNFYTSHATAFTTVPSAIEYKLISPTNNPYGPTNADGLYLVNCNGNKIVIKQCRIIGTLILLNPKSDSRLEISVNWKPARPDYPALIILGGDFTFIPDRSLSELELLRDLSRPGELGYLTMLDVYPNEINGMIYSNKNLTFSGTSDINGPVMAEGTIKLWDYTDIQYADNSLYETPPPCFQNSWLSLVPGSWKNITP